MKNCIIFFYISILITVLPCVAGSQVVFPVKASADGRYLVDQNNKPFPILGRTAWAVISQPVNRYHAFIENTLLHGYTAIEMAFAGSPFINKGERQFTPPGNNTSGQNDWVLKLQVSDF
jgi:hypothetical protein